MKKHCIKQDNEGTCTKKEVQPHRSELDLREKYPNLGTGTHVRDGEQIRIVDNARK